jgi:hypothetical protein
MISEPVFLFLLGALGGICVKNALELAAIKPQIQELWKKFVGEK